MDDQPQPSSSEGQRPPAAKRTRYMNYRKSNRWAERGAFDIEKLHDDLRNISSDSDSANDSGGSSSGDETDSFDIEADHSQFSAATTSHQSSQPMSESESDKNSDSDSSVCSDKSVIISNLIELPESDDEEIKLMSLPDSMAIHGHTETTVDEVVVSVMESFLLHNKTKTCLKKDLEILHSVMPSPNLMPKSVYLLLKYVDQYAPPSPVTVHYCCQQCQLYYGIETQEVCVDCGCKKSYQFHVFSIEDQLRYLFENRGLGDVLTEANEHRNTDEDTITDITDGSEYKRVNINRQPLDVTIILSTDGAAIKKSSKADFWPITFTIAEIPAFLRYKFITCLAVWYAKKKPEFNTFFQPLCVELKKLNSKGGVTWSDPKTKVKCTSQVSAPLTVGDAPVRAEGLNMQHHNGKRGCNTCEIKTTQITNVKEGERRVRVYKCVEPCKLRTKARIIVFGREAEETGKIVKGIKGRTILSLLPGVDESTVMFSEFMHSACLGVIKQILTKVWIKEQGRGIFKNVIPELEKFMEDIRAPSFFSRPARKLVSEIPFWKAYEFLYWALFYSIPAMLSVQDQQFIAPYLQHWMLFVIALSTLMQEKVKTDELEMAESLLKRFVSQVEGLYGEKQMSYNMHQLLHYCLYVRRWGPMHSLSSFPFEDFIGLLGKTVHGNNNIGKEISSKLRVSQGVQNLKSICEMRSNAPAEGLIRNDRCLGNPVKPVLTPDVLNLFDSSGISMEKVEIFSRARINRCNYSSLIYKNVQSRDYCVRYCEYNNPEAVIGNIQYFCTCEDNSYVVIRPLSVVQENLLFHIETRARLRSIFPVKLSGPPLIVNFKNIRSIEMLLLHNNNFVCLVPKALRNKNTVR